MKLKKCGLCLLTSCFLFGCFPSLSASHSRLTTVYEESTYDVLIQNTASLAYHVKECEAHMDRQLQGLQLDDSNQIAFSDEDILFLWDRAAHAIYTKNTSAHKIQAEVLFEEAYQAYHQAKDLATINEFTKAKELWYHCFSLLSSLNTAICEQESKSLWENQQPIKEISVHKAQDLILENNHYLSSPARKAMRPYLLPLSHPMRPIMDALFAHRVTLNPQTFLAAGFNAKTIRPRTFVCVASHPLLPGYLVKAYFDTELRRKKGKPSWQWLVQRCYGAQKIRNLINARQMKYFSVADKWIYPLPAEPSPPQDGKHTRHLAVLLVQDMQLTSDHLNYYAWYHFITKQHLNELYVIISRAKGSSYRPDNIAYTLNGKFAFIDTEYPSNGPDFRSIRRYLRPEMQKYWDRLVRRGGR